MQNIKALLVVLAIAAAVFSLAKPACLRFMDESAFTLRRNLWLALTIVGFLSPTFWLYAIFALVVLWWAARRDPNPLALFVVVTFTVPNAHFYIPGIVFQQLFDINQYRILSLAILLPFVMRSPRNDEHVPRALTFAQVLLIGFLLVQVAVLVPYDSGTNSMRRAFLMVLDVFLVFYAFSLVASERRIAEIAACFVLSCALMAPVAVFEWLKGWLLYTGLASDWGDPNQFAWIFRGGFVRAQAATGHSLNLGYVLSVGTGLLLFMWKEIPARAIRWLALVAFIAGMVASGSRGPWITGVLVILLFGVLRPNASGRAFVAALFLGALAFAILYFTPLNELVLERLPVIGSADQETITYRQRLVEASWPLILQNPWFGDPFVYLRMENLRQGQGIIDIVNGYLYTALFTGFVGLVLQVGALLTAAWLGARRFWRARTFSVTPSPLGAALIAVFVASLFYVAAAGFSPTLYIVAGLLASYSRVPIPAHRPLQVNIATGVFHRSRTA